MDNNNILNEINDKLDIILSKINIIIEINNQLGLSVDNSRCLTIQDTSFYHLTKSFLLDKKYNKDNDYIVDSVNRRMEWVESKIDLILASRRKEGIQFDYRTQEVDVSGSVYVQLLDKLDN